jgi:DNA-binding XRE family transcriptional regulator
MESPRQEAQRLFRILDLRVIPDEQIQDRVNIVRRLEELTTHQFVDTADFYSKMRDYLLSDETEGEKLRNERVKRGWSLTAMGIHLGVSKQFVSQMERNRKPLNINALRLIRQPAATTVNGGEIG